MTRRMLLAEYFLTEKQAVIVIAGGDDPEPELVTVPYSLAAIREVVTELNTAWESAPHVPAALARSTELLAHDLLVDLVVPVADRAAPGDRLWLIPHDALHRVPLHAVGEALTAHSVAYAPSASILRHCRAHRGGPRRRALAVVDPPATETLTFGAAQASLLAGLFSTETLAGTAASSVTITRRLAAGAPDILHVGTHGVFDMATPMGSGVLLADGLFTAERFMGLRLAGTLVVLAACRTGVSSTRPGDELLGLVRAVLHAGAPAVLVSLWTVDELATTMLLGRFYEGLAAGESAIDALRAAQGRLRELTALDVLGFLASVAPWWTARPRAAC